MGEASGGEFKKLEVGLIEPGFNPRRKVIKNEAFGSLVGSIREQGVIEPLVVRSKNGKFQLVCGERRWRAAQEVGLEVVPCVVRELSDVDAIRVALVENLEREDLDPLEEARGFERLRKEGMSVEAIGAAIKRSQPYVSNRMRLQKLPAKVKGLIQEGRLAVAAAMPLLTLPAAATRAQETLAEAAVKGRWSSREVDREVKDYGKVIDPGLLNEEPFCAKCGECPKGEKGRFRRGYPANDRVRSIKCFDEACYQMLHQRWSAAVGKEARAKLVVQAERAIAKIEAAGGMAKFCEALAGPNQVPKVEGCVVFNTWEAQKKAPCRDGRWDQGQSGRGAKGQSEKPKTEGCGLCGTLFYIRWQDKWANGERVGKSFNLGKASFCANAECWEKADERMWKEWCESESGEAAFERAKAEGLEILREEEAWNKKFQECVTKFRRGKGVDGQRKVFFPLEMCASCKKGRFVVAVAQEDGSWKVEWDEVCCPNQKCWESQDWEAIEEAADEAQAEASLVVNEALLQQVLEGSIPVEVWKEVMLEIVDKYSLHACLKDFWLNLPGFEEGKGVSFVDDVIAYVEGRLEAMKSDAGRIDWLQRMMCASWVCAGE